MPTTDQEVSSIKGLLTMQATQEFFASAPDVGEGVAGMRIAKDSPYGILAVYRSTDTYNFDDGTGTTCLLIDVDGNVTLTDASLIINGTLGYIAIGNPAPVHTGVGTWTGTGIGIDRAGIVGINTNVTQFSWDSTTGKGTAGAGAVTFDVNGITLAQGISAPNQIKWTNGVVNTPFMYGNIGSPTLFVLINNLSGTYTSSYAGIELLAQGDVASSSKVMIVATGNGSSPANSGYVVMGDDGSFLGVTIGTIGGAPTATLELKSSAPTFKMTDVTVSAKDLLITTDANATTFQEASGTVFMTLDLANNRIRVGDATAPQAQAFEIGGTAPTFGMYDTTASAKSLLLTTDANLSTFSEVGGAAPSLLVLDLANARVGIGVAPGQVFDLSTAKNHEGIKLLYTGASGASNSSRFTLAVNDGAAMASNDRMGEMLFQGNNGSGLADGALIITRATELWSNTARGNKFEFYTIPNTTTAQTLALTIDQNQSLTIAGGLNAVSMNGNLTISARNIVTDTTTGMKIGTATNQKLGFFNATPIVQGTAFTQTYSTASHTHTQATMTDPAAYVAGANGYSTGAMASAIHAEVIALHTNMTVVQNVLNGLIDDLQALGLVA